MKTLQDYTGAATTELLDNCGAFFAFSQSQFDEQKQEGVKYANGAAGAIVPVDKAAELRAGLDSIFENGVKADLAENGKAGIIHRELGNHEYSYTGDITDTVSALSGYGITAEEIQAETAEYMRLHNEWEEEQDRIYEESKKTELVTS